MRIRSVVVALVFPACSSDPAPAAPPPPFMASINGTLMQDLAASPLSTAALEGREDIASALRSGGDNLTLFLLAAECALRDDQSVSIRVDGRIHRQDGVYRYAPEWADGPCDEACQEWVTSCMLAKLNGYGVQVRIYFHTPTHAERGGGNMPQQYGYVNQEGAFYGNLFTDPPRIYACRGKDRDPLYDAFRICTHPGSPCIMEAIGPCLAADPAAPRACEAEEDGALARCHDRPGAAGAFPAGSRTYERTTTIYMLSSAFSGGLDADACTDGPAPGDFPEREVPAGGGGFGDTCAGDGDCEPGLACPHHPGPGICTTGCAEDADCGEGAVCRDADTGWPGCAAACTARIAGGAGCPQGQVCTGFHLFRAEADPTACMPLCGSDAECGGENLACWPRQGRCAGPVASGDGTDGHPCSSDADCRGFCLRVAGRGLCASLVAYGEQCPDEGVSPLFTDTNLDDLGVCIFRQCTDDGDCPDPLVCTQRGCDYPP